MYNYISFILYIYTITYNYIIFVQYQISFIHIISLKGPLTTLESM